MRLFIVFVFSFVTNGAIAGLLGETVALEWFFPTQGDSLGDNGQQVVGSGVEYPFGCCGFSNIYVDIGDLGFSVGPSGDGLIFSDGTFNGFKLTSISGPAFSNVTYTGGDLGVTSVFVQDGAIFANFESQSVFSSDAAPFAQFSLSLADEAAVPAPATVALLGLGLLVVRLRRKA